MSQTNKIILGFDPGFADTGWGVISKDNSGIKFIEAGSIKTSKLKDFSKRLQIIYKEADQLVKKYRPDIVAVEKLYFAKNAKTALDVGQARGVLLLAIIKNDKDILEFTPLQIKQAVCANGQASKKQVGAMVKALLKLSAVPKPDDAADALAAAICAAAFNKKLLS